MHVRFLPRGSAPKCPVVPTCPALCSPLTEHRVSGTASRGLRMLVAASWLRRGKMSTACTSVLHVPLSPSFADFSQLGNLILLGFCYLHSFSKHGILKVFTPVLSGTGKGRIRITTKRQKQCPQGSRKRRRGWGFERGHSAPRAPAGSRGPRQRLLQGPLLCPASLVLCAQVSLQQAAAGAWT